MSTDEISSSIVDLTYHYDIYSLLFFFFQAEDGIRDYKVTGVQTCALPISCHPGSDLQAAAVPALDALILIEHKRARPDQAHLAYEDVQELWQLVERAPPQIGRASCRERG